MDEELEFIRTITGTKTRIYNADSASGVSKLKAGMPLNRQISAWNRVEITAKHKDRKKLGVGSGKSTSLPGEEGAGSIQGEQGDTMQQGQCWVSKVHELQGTSGGRQG